MIRLLLITLLLNLFVSSGEAVHSKIPQNAGYVLVHKTSHTLASMTFRNWSDCQRFKKTYYPKVQRVQYKCVPIDPD